METKYKIKKKEGVELLSFTFHCPGGQWSDMAVDRNGLWLSTIPDFQAECK